LDKYKIQHIKSTDLVSIIPTSTEVSDSTSTLVIQLLGRNHQSGNVGAETLPPSASRSDWFSKLPIFWSFEVFEKRKKCFPVTDHPRSIS